MLGLATFIGKINAAFAFSARPPVQGGCCRGLAFQHYLFLAMCALFVCSPMVSTKAAEAVSPVGLWEAFDTHSGKATGRMIIYQEGDLFFGRNAALSPSDRAGERCTHCQDERNEQPLIGLVIMRNMRFDHGMYSGGDILDPSTGRVYSCEFRLTDGGQKMILRGFLGVPFLGGSQEWRRLVATETGAPTLPSL